MKGKITAFIFANILLISGCYYINHDEKSASIEAEKFARNAFINKDFAEAYKFLPDEIDSKFTVDSLKDLVEKMHSSGEYPSQVNAKDYEIVPGKNRIKIYLEGIGNGQTHYYLIVTGRTGTSSYKIYEMYRNEVPYPTSTLRQPLN